jgi:hypothetical protein
VSERFKDSEQILKDTIHFYEFSDKRKRRNRKARG